jgi:hypothetical protein
MIFYSFFFFSKHKKYAIFNENMLGKFLGFGCMYEFFFLKGVINLKYLRFF